jgi:hypothetical protein
MLVEKGSILGLKTSHNDINFSGCFLDAQLNVLVLIRLASLGMQTMYGAAGRGLEG